MSKIDLENEKSKWLEERMKQESEEAAVPESLEPEQILKKLKMEKPKTPKYNWKKTAILAASFLVAAGVSLQVGSMVNSNSPKSSSNSEEMSMDATTNEADQAAEQAAGNSEVNGTEEKKTADTETEKNAIADQLESDSSLELKSQQDDFYEQQSFTEGEGKAAAVTGSIIYTGSGKDVVVSQYAEGTVNEITRITLNQEAKEFYQTDNMLVCISTDGNGGTTIYGFDITNKKSPQMNATISAGGNLKCSYLEGNILYVFTDTGNLQRMDLSNSQTNTFSVAETSAKYYMSGESVYTFQKDDEGTSIQKYVLSNGSFTRAEQVICKASMDAIAAVKGDGVNLELLAAEEDGASLHVFDQQMRLVKTKKNILGAKVFAGEFTEKGILVYSYSETDAAISMLDEESMETRHTAEQKNRTQIRKGNLVLDAKKMWFGFTAKEAGSGTFLYGVFSYDAGNGFTEIKSTETGNAAITGDFLVNDAVLDMQADGIEVLLK